MRGFLLSIAALIVARSAGAAQEAVRLVELFPPDYQYRVSCRVALEGQLSLPPTKEQAAQSLKITGKSFIEYHEKVLNVTGGKVAKTVRKVQRLEFVRKVGDLDQESKLRSDIDLLVIQRLQNLEVPFSPRGPLLVSEIDLVRTDVFTPALAGLLPRTPVRMNDTWTADLEAVKELTDLEHVDKGVLTCRFEGLDFANPKLARVSFKGAIRGVGEDGPAEHQLEGAFFFDLAGNHLSYLSLEGKHLPLDKAGLPQGEIKGIFVLTRDPAAQVADLSKESLERWDLTANDDNTQLLFDTAGVRFLYPRHWRLEETNGRQIRLVERQGSDLLITPDPLTKLPTTAQFQKEAFNGLLQQKAQLVGVSKPRAIPVQTGTLEHFSMEARFGVQPAAFDYYVVRQNGGGATLSLRSLPAQAPQRQRDAERIAKGLSVNIK